MKFLRIHRKICSVVAALMVAAFVVYSYGSFRSYAATSVSTLPVGDIGADVNYDADSITLNYNGSTYVFNRHMSFDELVLDLESVDKLDSSLLYKVQHVNGSDSLYWYVSSNKYYKVDFISGEYLEKTNSSGYASPVSYWLSPSYNCIYILYNDLAANGSSVIVRSYCDGSFYYILNPANSSAPYWKHTNSLCYNLTTKSFDLNVSHYPDFVGSHMFDSSRTVGLSTNYPTDLVCIFSNYEINGFYEFDNSKVNTPSYYFNFQYIFYKKGYGYIFVDAVKRVREVGFPSGVTNPRFYYESECNSYVYSSKDGISWILLSTVSDMYAAYFEVSCGYSFTDYTLIYTNDSSFGVPLVVPKWDTFDDSVMKDIIGESNSGYKLDTGKEYGKYSTESVWAPFIHQLALQLDTSFSQDVIFGNFSSTWKGDNTNNTWENYSLLFLMTELSSDYILSGDEGTLTLFGYVKRLNELIENNNIYLSSMLERADSRLNSIYQNITLSNQYLKRISDNFDSLSIPAAAPDYSSQFDQLSAALDKLHNDLIYEEGVTKLPNVPQYLVYVYGVTKDIRTRLDTVISKLPGSVEVDTDSIVSAVTDMQTAVIDKLDDVIAKIPTSSGGGSFDDSNMVGSIAALKSDISGNFETLIKLLQNDVDGVEGIQDLTSFITSYVVSMGNAAYFTTLLDFADGVKNNVTLINETMVTMVSDSGIFAPIFTLGAGFAVFSGLIRKERMS